MVLEKELETYNRNLPELLTDVGKFAVIQQNEIAGVYSSYDDALKVGYEKYGLNPFLVKRIESIQTVHHFTRSIMPCLS